MKKKLDELFYMNYRGNKKITEKMSSKHKKLAKNGIFDAFWPERESKRRLNIFFMVLYAIHDKKIIFMHRFYKISENLDFTYTSVLPL